MKRNSWRTLIKRHCLSPLVQQFLVSRSTFELVDDPLSLAAWLQYGRDHQWTTMRWSAERRARKRVGVSDVRGQEPREKSQRSIPRPQFRSGGRSDRRAQAGVLPVTSQQGAREALVSARQSTLRM
jgi:hypothetical protein